MSSVIVKNQYYNQYQKLRFVRYPGGKNRLLPSIIPFIPSKDNIKRHYVEPFAGSGSVFFCINPKNAILSDTNRELIELYRGIKNFPEKVWSWFVRFPNTKNYYYQSRNMESKKRTLAYRAARILYLNRTCFKGMWRYNQNGEFNVGYGGQDRRWAIDEENLIEVSKRLRNVSLKTKDFEEIIDNCFQGDFLFLDPPYSAGKKDTIDYHYGINQFKFEDHIRLAKTLRRASRRGVKWAMTTSSHKDIQKLFTCFYFHPISMGIGKRPGILSMKSGEILITNYNKIANREGIIQKHKL